MSDRWIRIAVPALRKNGTMRYAKDGKVIRQRIRAQIVARKGVWAITRSWVGGKFVRALYTVTHIPTGIAASQQLSLQEAKRLLIALASMPDQDRWRRLRSVKHLTPDMKSIGHDTVQKVYGFGNV